MSAGAGPRSRTSARGRTLGGGLAAGGVDRRSLGVAMTRQPDRRGRAVRAGAGDVDGATMPLDDLAHGWQAEADAETLGGEQRLEDARQHVRWNARTVVDDRQTDMRPGALRPHGDAARIVLGRHPGGVLQRLNGVVDDAEDGLLEALAIDGDLVGGAQIALERDPLRQRMTGEQLREPGAERIAQLVADSGRDLADSGHALGARELLHGGLETVVGGAQLQLGILALGDVRADADDAAL